MTANDIINSQRQLIPLLKGPILVIGASGFIGANLLHSILPVRSDVVGTFFSGEPWRLKDIPSANLHFCNTQDELSVDALLHKIEPKTIFDCSAFGAYSFEQDAARIHTTNYLSLIRLLEKLRGLDIAAYVHAGSSSEYGLNADGPVESAPAIPNSHYAVSKGAASLAICYYGKMLDLPAVNLRLYSAYGPWEDSSRLIPTLCRNSLDGFLPHFAKESTSRDFIHVDDVVCAFLLSAVQMDKTLYGESFNIGTGVKTSLADLAQLSMRIFSIKEKAVFSRSESRPWDVDDWYANVDKAKKMLGFTAITSLESGLIKSRAWWQQMATSADCSRLTKKGQERQEKNSISAVIACYKDNQAIPIMHQRLTDVFTRLGLDYEIIFVNDCSPDDTTEIIREISARDPHIIGITHSRNFGSQAAFRSGMELASKEAVVLLDGDLQDPPELTEKFVDEWRKGADVVYGRRVQREMSRPLEACYKLFYRIFAKLSEVSIPKDAGDFSLIDRTVVYWLLQCRERDFFLRGLRAFVGFKQVGVDYVRPERMFGVSTNNWIRNIGWAKKGIFSFTRIPLHLMTAFGAISTIGTVCLAIWAIGSRLFFPESTPKGITFMVLLILFFGSTTLLCLGLLGEYLGKIFEESKARPAVIRKELILRGTVRKETQRNLRIGHE